MAPPPPRYQRGTSNKRSLADDAPFHQPSRAMSVESMEHQAYPHEKWTEKETSWCFGALLDMQEHTMGPSEKLRAVRREWGGRALNKNDRVFSVDRVPGLPDVRRFSEYVAGQIERQQFAGAAASGGASASAVVSSAYGRRPVLKRARKRKRIRFHSNTDNDDDPGYLPFPITKHWAEKNSSRKVKAYCRALGIKFKSGGQRQRLLDALAKENDSIPRPTTAPGGLSWSEWYFEISL